MALRFLVTTIHLDHVAQALEGMERKTDRQNDSQAADLIIPTDHLGEAGGVRVEKVKIFKNEQDRADRENAQRKITFLSYRIIGLFDPDTGVIIDHDRDEQDQD